MTGNGPSIAEVAALVGDPARANILSVLMDGRSLTATELAFIAGVAPQTTSGHLSKLTEARLLSLEKQGRHRYYRLKSPLVARMLEGIMAVAETSRPQRQMAWRGGEALRTARTCYDHLAGRLGVALTDSLTARNDVVLSEDGGEISATGRRFLTEFGIGFDQPAKSRRCFCRPCLDWSERRPHLAGRLGAALATRSFELGWIERIKDTRAVAITRRGLKGFADVFDIVFPLVSTSEDDLLGKHL